MKQFKLTFVLTVLMSMVGLQTFAAWDTSTKVYVGLLYYYLDKTNLKAEVVPTIGGYNGSITIPSSITYQSTSYSVTRIDDYAFRDCIDLTSIIIPNSVTSIGANAFSRCSKLTSITIPNSVTSLLPGVFASCSGLTSITIHNSVTSIGSGAFRDCTGLTSITIPNSVTSISDGAFSGCSGLTSITIPNSVTYIGENPLENCPGLTSIIVESGNTNYDTRNNCNAIIEKASNTLIAGCKNTVIPNSVTSIAHYAFNGCSGLTSITIPNSVTSIGYDAFNGCSGLTSITIPNSVTSIGSGVFQNCTDLASMTVESGNTVYDSRNNCNAIIERTSNILVYGCKNTTIPNSVTSIGSGAFYGCSGLTSITIPNSVTSIEGGAFEHCTGLASITIPNSVTSIGSAAFAGCSSLTSITIPNSVTSIGDGAFDECSSLTSITIPNSVTSIGDFAFSDCNALTSVTVKRKSPITISSNVFSNYANATLYVPSVAAYEAAAVWTNFNVITEMSESFTMNNLGKSTYCSEYPLDFTNVSGIEAYIISGFDPSGGKLIRTRVYEVPAETGLFIIGTPGATYNIPVKETDFYYANMMKGITVAKVIPTYEDNCTNFILVPNGNGGVYFTRSNGNETTAANRAYVQIPTSIAGSRGFLDIEDDDSTTGLNGVFTPDTKEAEAVYYNLSGQKVQKPQKGIYIKNGKKIIIH